VHLLNDACRQTNTTSVVYTTLIDLGDDQMPTLLHLDSSPLETSISRELGREFVKTWKTAHADSTVIYRDLAVAPPKPLDATWIFSSFMPEASRTAEQTAALAVSEELIGELERADEYVIGVAMHNFSIPSTLKLWIDQVSRAGRTFSYGESGPKGLLVNKKATLLIATGGAYEPGTPFGAFNFVEPYLRAVLGFLGVTELNVINVGGTAALMGGKVDRGQFLESSLEQVRTVAA
jgi:FMN-dependent NADH-azoreductase